MVGFPSRGFESHPLRFLAYAMTKVGVEQRDFFPGAVLHKLSWRSDTIQEYFKLENVTVTEQHVQVDFSPKD